MQRSFIAFLMIVCGLPLFATVGFAGDSWPQFRGPGGDGIASDQSVPVEFGEQNKVQWKTSLPGRGWSSPVVADNAIWVTTAVERVPDEAGKIALLKKNGIEEKKFKQLAIAEAIDLQLVALDLDTGSMLHNTRLTTITDPDPIHSLNSYSSPTPVIDGDQIYCHFGTYGTFCLDRKTRRTLWQRRLPLDHSVGPGSSPFVHDNLLILIQDGIERQYVIALDKATGETVWERDRPEMEAPDGDRKKAYCTPIAIKGPKGREQLICLGSQWIVAYRPESGEEIWRCYHGKGFSVVPRPVYADGVVYFSTGFTKPELYAVAVDGSGDVSDTHVQWVVKQGIPAKPSPVLHDGLIYVVADAGIASCIQASDGEVLWKQRLGGDFSASPILAGDYLYFGSHDGEVFVIEPGSEGKIVATNQIDGKIMASPAAVNDSLILRTDKAIYKVKD